MVDPAQFIVDRSLKAKADRAYDALVRSRGDRAVAAAAAAWERAEEARDRAEQPVVEPVVEPVVAEQPAPAPKTTAEVLWP